MIVHARSKTECRTAACWYVARILLGIAPGVVLFRSLWDADPDVIAEVAYVEN